MMLHKIHKYWWNGPTFGPGMIALLVLVCMTIHCIHWERPNPTQFYICIFTQGSNIDCVVTKELESKLEKLIELFLAIHTLHVCQETSKTWLLKHFVGWELQLATSSPPVLLVPCPLFSALDWTFSSILLFSGKVADLPPCTCCLSSWQSLLQRPNNWSDKHFLNEQNNHYW